MAGTGPVLPAFRWHATAQISRILVDFVETITYRQGRFFRTSRVIPGPPGPEVQLGTADLQALLVELNDQREQPPPDVDVRALQAFIDLVSGAIP